MTFTKHFDYKTFIRKYYLLSRLLFVYKLYKSGLNQQPILIYQMGKVGSTSILQSLEELGRFPSVFQVHSLTAAGLLAMEKMYWGKTPVLLRKSLLPETTHIYVSHSLRSKIKRSESRRWKIITLVRDPIARNVSEFFYSVDTTKSDPYLPDFYRRLQAGTITTKDLMESFLDRFQEGKSGYAEPLTWFDREFRPVTGVDVYSSAFPQNVGYQILQSGSFDILILKLEMLRDCAQDAFRAFLDLSDFCLVTTNTANQKNYYSAYRDFVAEVQLPADYVEKVYANKYVQHFYSQAEITQFTNKWLKT